MTGANMIVRARARTGCDVGGGWQGSRGGSIGIRHFEATVACRVCFLCTGVCVACVSMIRSIRRIYDVLYEVAESAPSREEAS